MNSVWSSATTSKLKFLFLIGVAMQISACTQFFFYPGKQMVRTPDDIGLDYEDVHLETQDNVKLHGWLLKAEQPKALVLFFHGNAENISTHIGSVFWLPEQGYDVLMVDYRGFGLSEGEPSIPEVFMDAHAAYEWALDYREQYNRELFVLGQSMGAAVSSYVFSNLPADTPKPKAVILDAVFSGHKDIAKVVLGGHWLTWPLQFFVVPLLPGDYNPKDHIQKLSPVPVLFFHSPQDQIIPYEEGQIVFEQAAAPKYWVTTEGRHIATFGLPMTRNILLRFLESPQTNPLTQPETVSPTDRPQTGSNASPLQTSTSDHGRE